MNQKRILVWCDDKTGLEKLGGLSVHGWKIISTGSTLSYLKAHHVSCEDFSDKLHLPEFRNTELKITNSSIFDNILSEIMVINITISKINIHQKVDTQKPYLLLVAGSNWESVTPVTDYHFYDSLVDEVIHHGHLTEKSRAEYLKDAFGHLSLHHGYIRMKIKEHFEPASPKETLSERHSMRVSQVAS